MTNKMFFTGFLSMFLLIHTTQVNAQEKQIITIKKIENGDKDERIIEITKDGETKVFRHEGDGEFSHHADEFIIELNTTRDEHGENVKKVILKTFGPHGDHDELNDEDNLFFFHRGHKKHKHHSERQGNPNKAQLGVMISNHEKGTLVESVFENSGAQKAGLMEGDVITKIESQNVTGIQNLIDQIGAFDVGQNIKVTFLREGETRTVDVVLGPGEKKTQRHRHKRMDKSDHCHPGYGWIFDTGKKHKCTIIIKEDNDKEEKSEVVEENETDVDITIPESTLELDGFKMYPNPSDGGDVQIEFRGAPIPVTVQVTDLTGRVLYKRDVDNFNGKFSGLVRFQNDVNGILVVSVRQDNKVFTEKLFIQ